MKDLTKAVRTTLFEAEDSVCLQRARLLTEVYTVHENDPPPIRQARYFAHILAGMDLDLSSNPIFAGNTSSRPRAMMLNPEYGFSVDKQTELENPGLASVMEEGVPDDLREFWADRSLGKGSSASIGHLAVDLHTVVHEGLESVIQAARHAGTDGGDAQSNYRAGMVIALQAVCDWSLRYSKKAALMAENEGDALRRDLYLRISDACRNVPGKPARNLFEGLQAIALVHLATAIEGQGVSVSIGLPDRVLAPFIDSAVAAEEVVDLISGFLLKIAANSFQGRGSKTQAITVGGADSAGIDQCNALTLAFLDACAAVRVGDPHLFLRWHPGIDPTVEQRASELLSEGLSMPLLISDTATAGGLINAGIHPEHAWEYCVIGCNELGIPGRLSESAYPAGGSIQYLSALNDTIGDPDCPASMEGVLQGMSTRMAEALESDRESGRVQKQLLATRLPTPFTSALMHGCVATGTDLLLGMEYHCAGVYERGFTNAVNGLAAINELCFEKSSMTLSELSTHIDEDFADIAALQSIVACPKWGTGDDSTDALAERLLRAREAALGVVYGPDSPVLPVVCHVVRSLHHLGGAALGATPDGRRRGAPLADSIGAETGTASGGLSGILRSVARIKSNAYYRGGYNLNITVSPETATADILASLVRGFFTQGGQELQINCLSADVLNQAMAHPTAYGDLIVRIAGFSARFIDLPEMEQLELVERAKLAG
jgi:pyruvate-formate lyase